MRNQTKIAVVASILVFLLGFSWYFVEWDVYSHHKILSAPAEYEYIDKTIMEMTASTIMASIVCIVGGVTGFILVAPKDVLKNGLNR